MAHIISKAISLVLIIVIGYLIKKLKWVEASDFPKFSKILLRVTLPCALITNFNNYNIPLHVMFLIVIGIVVNVIQQMTRYFLNRNTPVKEQAFGIFNSGSYNIGAFATPYISGFIGPGSMLFASIFDIGNSIAAAGLGYGFGSAFANEKQKISIVNIIKSMFVSPVFDTYLFLLIMRLLDLHMPWPIITFTSTVGSANTFVAMLMIGIGLELSLHKDKLKKALNYLLIRYAYSIIFTIITILFIPIANDIKTVLCMLYFAPIAAMISGFTGEIDGDVETSTFMTSVSIIIGIIVMPLIFIIISKI